MLLAAKPATASARISSDSAPSLLVGLDVEQMGLEAGLLERFDERRRSAVGAPPDGHAPGRQVDARAFHAGKPAERLLDRPNACAAMNRGHRQIGLAHAVGYDAACEQHFLAGCARIRQQRRQFRSRTATTHRNELQTPRVKTQGRIVRYACQLPCPEHRENHDHSQKAGRDADNNQHQHDRRPGQHDRKIVPDQRHAGAHGGQAHRCAPLSSIGMEKALMANANAANRPPTALPTTSIAQPTSVVNSMGMMRSRPGNGRRPKNSA